MSLLMAALVLPMRRTVPTTLGAAAAALLVTSLVAQVTRSGAQDFAAARLTAHPTTSWPTNGGNLYNQRYSPLTALDRTNVGRLKGVWRTPLRGSGTAPKYSGFAAPIVYDGSAYVSTGANDVFALSLDTGEILWQYAANVDPNITSVCCGWNSKGVAVSEDKVFAGQLDGKLVALDRATGRVVWSIQAERWQESFSITAAPLYVEGKVIVGFAGGDRGARGRIKAYDARDGKLLWTFYTIPGPGETGHETWPKDNDAWKHGGAAIWQTPAVDPALGLLYFSTGNAGPDYNGAFRAGDNLFAASIVAIELETGKYRWHFQQVHHDIWDYDAVNPVVLFDVPIAGRTRRALAEVGKTGWAYILDRETGKPLIGIDEKPVPQEPRQKTAATQPFPRGDAIVPQFIEMAPEGSRLVNDGRIFTPFLGNVPTLVLPGIWGGASWPPSSYESRAASPVRLRLVGDQRLHRGRRRTVRRAEARCRLSRWSDVVHARAADRHPRRARRHDQQAGLALSVAGAVLQRHAGHRRRSALRRAQRRPAHGARLVYRRSALGVSDRGRHARAGESVRASRQAARAGVLGWQRAARNRARRQRVAARTRRHAAARVARHGRAADGALDGSGTGDSARHGDSPRPLHCGWPTPTWPRGAASSRRTAPSAMATMGRADIRAARRSIA